MRMERIWAMPSQWTFTIGPIKQLLLEESSDYSKWADPFCGKFSPAGTSNDLRQLSLTQTHNMCALDFLKSLPDGQFDGVLYDPPYSIHQAKECYESVGMKNLAGSMKWWREIKDQIGRVTKAGGKVISCGWQSNGIGKGRGFEMTRVLLVNHGGSKNDTIVTVEVRV